MAFDFPDAPAVGDEFVSGGATYTWTGAVWDLGSSAVPTDYVLKSGDTMTGDLNVVAPAKVIAQGTPPDTCGFSLLEGGSSARTGIVGFFASKAAAGDPDVRLARLGWGTATDIEFAFENGNTGLRMIGGGIRWGNDTAVTNPLDMTKGICLYGWGTTSKFGFSITSGTLNLSVENAVNLIAFNVGAEQVMNVKSDGVRIPGGNLSVTGTISATGTISSGVAQGATGLLLSDGVKIDFSSGCQIRKVYGSNQFQFHTNASQVFAFHISNTGDVFIIDTVGSAGNSYSATAPEALALGAELGVARRKPETEGASEGVDLVKMMAALLAKVNRLEVEIAALKGTAKPFTGKR
jgi:hypothetical protein